MNPTEITLRITRVGENSGSSLRLQLIEAATGAVIEEQIPPDLKLKDHGGDYATYREFFLKQATEHVDFGSIGRHLFALLNLGEVGKRWKTLIAGKKQDENLRVHLDINIEGGVDQELGLLPWELISNGAEQWFQDTEDSIIRVHNYETEEDPKIVKVNWPIRLLVVVGGADDSIGAAEEVDKIEDVLREVNRLIDVDVIEHKTIDELETKCTNFRPHIFHYIGHGAVDAQKNSKIFLVDNAGKNAPWSATEIGSSLRAWKWFPRFVFINACRTAGSKTPTLDGQVASWGVGDAFRSLKIPAVLTMQADVRGTLAGTFAGEVYTRLARGESIDRATAGARVKVRNNTPGVERNNTRDWAAPVLSISIPPEKILPLKPTSEERETDIRLCEKFQEVSVLANRRDDRRKFIHGFHPISDQKTDWGLTMVRGGKDSGKTWLTLWCLEACAWQNHDVRYVEVVGKDSPSWLEVLTQIQRGDESKATAGRYQLIYRPLDQKAFNEFNHELQHRIKNETPPVWDKSDVPFKELDVKDLENLPENQVKEIFKSFCKALPQAAAEDNPLIIVFDQFTHGEARVSDPHMNKFLIPYLFAEAAAGNLKSAEGKQSVRLVLILNDDELKMYAELEKKLGSQWHEVNLEEIPAEDFEKVVKEFYRNLKAAPERVQGLIKNATKEQMDRMYELYASFAKTPWKPSVLGSMRENLINLQRQFR
jgi:hypothetical protein